MPEENAYSVQSASLFQGKPSRGPNSSFRSVSQDTVVIVGGGWQGSVAALELARSGRKVIILERGNELVVGTTGHCSRFPLSGIHWMNGKSSETMYNACRKFYEGYPGPSIAGENTFVRPASTLYLLSQNSTYGRDRADKLVRKMNEYHAHSIQEMNEDVAGSGYEWQATWSQAHGLGTANNTALIIDAVQGEQLSDYCSDAVHSWQAAEGVFDWEAMVRKTQGLLDYYKGEGMITACLNRNVQAIEYKDGKVCVRMTDTSNGESEEESLTCSILIDCSGRLTADHSESQAELLPWLSVGIIEKNVLGKFAQTYKFHIEACVRRQVLIGKGLLERFRSMILVWGDDGFSITILDDPKDKEILRMCVTSEPVIKRFPYPPENSQQVQERAEAVLDDIAKRSSYWSSVFKYVNKTQCKLFGNSVVKMRQIDQGRGKPFVVGKMFPNNESPSAYVAKVITDKLVIAPGNVELITSGMNEFFRKLRAVSEISKQTQAESEECANQKYFLRSSKDFSLKDASLFANSLMQCHKKAKIL